MAVVLLLRVLALALVVPPLYISAFITTTTPMVVLAKLCELRTIPFAPWLFAVVVVVVVVIVVGVVAVAL